MEESFRIHAGAVTCLRSKDNSRTIGGSFIFNTFHGEPTVNPVDEIVITIIHEVFHAIFFDILLFKLYPKNKLGQSATFKDKNGTTRIRSDTFIEVARRHFNCKHLQRYICLYFDSLIC